MFKPKNTKEQHLHRLKIAKGHVQKIIEMVGNDTYCLDVVHQSQAVQKALHEFDSLVLSHHLESCTADDIKHNKLDQVVREVMKTIRLR